MKGQERANAKLWRRVGEWRGCWHFLPILWALRWAYSKGEGARERVTKRWHRTAAGDPGLWPLAGSPVRCWTTVQWCRAACLD